MSKLRTLWTLSRRMLRSGVRLLERQPLDAVNKAFHQNYDAARSGAERQGPVLVVIAGSLVLHRNRDRDRVERAFTPRIYDVIKSAAHAPVALYAALQRGDEPRARLLRSLDASLAASLESLDREVQDAEVAGHMRDVLERTLKFVAGESDSTALDAFAGQVGPLMLVLTDHATRYQLAALHQVAESLLGELTSEEKRTLRVVVAGVHQVRARSLAMQYFQRRLREPEGAEERVTYAEGATTEEEALALAGTQRLDRAIAMAFFGEAKRLQRDVLGDATKRLLAEMDLPPLV